MTCFSTPPRRWFPFPAVYGLFLLIVWSMYRSNLRDFGGIFVYGLDDPYIHLAIVRNLMQKHVWGVVPGEFGFSASSLLWPLALWGGCSFTGFTTLMPLILNVVLSGCLLAFVTWVLLSQGFSDLMVFLILFLIAFATPLIGMTVIGMEHIAHIFFTLLFVRFVSESLASPEKPGLTWITALIAPLMCMARYEGMFPTFVAACLFWRQRRFGGITACLVGLVPIIGFGLYSMSQGWFFLPNPVLLKGNAPNFSSPQGIIASLGYAAFQKAGQVPPLALLLIFSLAFVIILGLKGKANTPAFHSNRLFFFSALLHLQFADVGWFFRYEAYLLAWGIFGLALAWKEVGSLLEETLSPSEKRLAILAGGYCLGLTMLFRACLSMMAIPLLFMNIFQQQIQMAKFLKTYYSGASVAVNDIGAVSLYAEVGIMDLWGLADKEMATAIRERKMSPEFLGALAEKRGVRIAAAYESLLQKYGGVPSNWEKIGTWRIPCNVICGESEICFYAVIQTERDNLRKNLKEFAKILPDGVTQEILFSNHPSEEHR